MMPMTPENALYLAKQRSQDMLHEAEADRMYHEAQRGSTHLASSLLSSVRAALSALATVSQHQTMEKVTTVEKAANEAGISVAKPSAG
jgi:hypothetical protein